MPPVHLEVELAFPAVEGQPGLLRREPAGALDGRQVLRQHDAPLEFPPAGIGAAGEIDRAAGGPEPVPVPRAARRAVLERRQRLAPRGAGANATVSSNELGPLAGVEHVPVRPGLAQRRGRRTTGPTRDRRPRRAVRAKRASFGPGRVSTVCVRVRASSSRLPSPAPCRRGTGTRPRSARFRQAATRTRTLTASSAGWHTVSTSTGSPSKRKRLVSTPFQRSSVCRTPARSAGTAAEPSACVSLKPMRPR